MDDSELSARRSSWHDAISPATTGVPIARAGPTVFSDVASLWPGTPLPAAHHVNVQVTEHYEPGDQPEDCDDTGRPYAQSCAKRAHRDAGILIDDRPLKSRRKAEAVEGGKANYAANCARLAIRI